MSNILLSFINEIIFLLSRISDQPSTIAELYTYVYLQNGLRLRYYMHFRLFIFNLIVK